MALFNAFKTGKLIVFPHSPKGGRKEANGTQNKK
jgi:hypothetical protein